MNFTWDWNEWFIVFTSFGALCVYFPIRKHFNTLTTIVIWLYGIAFVETIDYFLAATPFQTYYFSDNATYEPSTALIHYTQYPCAAFLFLYFYDRWKLKGYKLTVYILAWTALSICYEWICVANRVITYTGWKLVYSIPTYPIASVLLLAIYGFIGKHAADPMPDEGGR